MRVRISQSFGYAGTESYWEEEVPEDIAELSPESDAFQQWYQEQYDGIWGDMCERLELSLEVIA